ncbi:hypothetical protein N7462_004368 [Penicillium macrosclerotiorum]|uniref:uncharacterized protein n=1 Tax=Penicillium macrosclerotiorum TaxID=303699 RepID=UPI0025491425|nr:uncharacterized protein N7462_004368 [Penicillium macrosclerotiorum]KAJ5689976.1 hypothetical protein N7462_004368 [Penicillium macrosclerotiorum]
MQSMPLLIRQSLRSSIHLARTTARPVQSRRLRPTPPNAFTVNPASRSFSVCLQCQFRQHPDSSFPHDDKEKPISDAERLINAAKEANSSQAIPLPGPSAGSSGAVNTSATDSVKQIPPKLEEQVLSGQIEPEKNTDQSPNAEGEQRGGLPSYIESRRSKMSKQFSTMMDNLQSNVFVAGQRLNDLTGYSGIEALKNEIHTQENRLRAARAQVRKAKEDYTTAINRRSASQREVNDLLQRKHAWSSTDLERFTLLYRNDHTNEVAETETQEALSLAEREAEEAAASLSKCILSRYHEEQVWSDKIRRMSTWGTWGLMGMNVLLFLIFQIAVEPWRRRRLVKGFEDKVVEALEKEKALHRTGPEGYVMASTLPEVIDSTVESSIASIETPSSDAAPVAAEVAASPESTLSETTTLSASLPPPLSLEYWQQVLNEFFNERTFVISQRDLTLAAVQSAAAGAAVMGLLIALVRPR